MRRVLESSGSTSTSVYSIKSVAPANNPPQPKRHLPVTGRSGCPLLFLFFHFSAFQTKQTEQRAHKNRFSVIRVRFCSFSTPNPIPRVFQVFHFPFPSLILAIPFVFCFSEKNLARKRKLFDLVLFFSFRLNSSF